MAGIYVHVPFCGAKCAYCDFYSIANQKYIAAYADAVTKEWHQRSAEVGTDDVRTIYFGGGTPSLLTGHGLAQIAALFPKDRVEEMTIEVNPEHVSAAAARSWRAMGFNRVSMGVQSLVDEELISVGRRHSAREALVALDTLRAAGFDNVSADLIYGLPGQTVDSWCYSLDTLLGTGIEHLSAYCLSYEEGTRLYRMREQGRVTEADEDTVCAMYGALYAAARTAGFEHYEISNFARPGYRSRHNSSYWQGTPYLGLGPGAHSMGADGVRRYVLPDLKAYVAEPAACLCIDEESETDRVNDTIMTALRRAEGLDLEALPPKYRSAVRAAAHPWVGEGKLQQQGSRLRIPEEDWLLADAIIRDLLCD